MREKEEVHNWVLPEFGRLEKAVEKTSRYQGKRIRAWGQDQTKADESISSSKKEAQSNDDEKAGGGKCVKGNMIEER